jgi:hypothetical protein
VNDLRTNGIPTLVARSVPSGMRAFFSRNGLRVGDRVRVENDRVRRV